LVQRVVRDWIQLLVVRFEYEDIGDNFIDWFAARSTNRIGCTACRSIG
jgi:hypothetical protein